eukprot:41672-Pelagomonas_calceolata.AAC.3
MDSTYDSLRSVVVKCAFHELLAETKGTVQSFLALGEAHARTHAPVHAHVKRLDAELMDEIDWLHVLA